MKKLLSHSKPHPPLSSKYPPGHQSSMRSASPTEATEGENFDSILPANKLAWLQAYTKKLQSSQRGFEMPESSIENIDLNVNLEDDVLNREVLTAATNYSALPVVTDPNSRNLSFQPYKSTRPDLLQHLESIVSKQLRVLDLSQSTNVSKKTPIGANIAKAPTEHEDSLPLSYYSSKRAIYSQAFDHYIYESTLYKKFLCDVKSSYDTYIDKLVSELKRFGGSDEQVKQRKLEVENKYKEQEHAFKLKVYELNDKIQSLEEKLASVESDKRRSETECAKARDLMLSMKVEYDTMKISCNNLTSSLSRMEADHRTFQGYEAKRLAEISHLKSSEQKLAEENERLQQSLHNLELIHSRMVSSDVVSGLEATIESLKGEIKRVEIAHKQLLSRYASLKGIVDDCFKKWESIEKEPDQKTKYRIESFIDNPTLTVATTRKSSPQRAHSTDPIDKVLNMMEITGNPRLILEVMLDNIGLHARNSKRNRHSSGSYFELDTAFMGKDSMVVNSSTVYEEDPSAAAEEVKSPWSHYDGLGYAESVPLSLRIHGKVQNMFFSKQEIVRILVEIWQARHALIEMTTKLTDSSDKNKSAPSAAPNEDAKQQQQQNSNNRKNIHGSAETPVVLSESLIAAMPINPSMPIFLELYLADKFKDKIFSSEMAYNIMDALKRYSYVSDCKMFSAVLEEKLPITIWEHQRDMLDRVRGEVVKELEIIKATSVGTDPSNEGKIACDFLIRLVRRLQLTAPEPVFIKLTKALSLDNQNSRYVNPEDVLFEHSNGKRPHFLEQLKLQHINEALSFEKTVMDSIEQYREGDESEMPVGKLRDALIAADSRKPRSEINQLLARGCGNTIEEMLLMEAKRLKVSVESFKKKLRSGLLVKSAPNALNNK